MTACRTLDQLDTLDGDSAVRVVIEVSAGSRNKLKYNPSLAAFELHHVLPLGACFPYDFGFMPSTLGEDGDPLDALVFTDEPSPPGTIVRCRLVGVIEARQTRQGREPFRNDRLLAVAQQSHFYRDWHDLGDLPASLLEELESFFVFYNRQRGESFTPLGRRDAARAAQLLEQGRRRRQKA
jgi:inorganic pyrophosphatase